MWIFRSVMMGMERWGRFWAIILSSRSRHFQTFHRHLSICATWRFLADSLGNSPKLCRLRQLQRVTQLTLGIRSAHTFYTSVPRCCLYWMPGSDYDNWDGQDQAAWGLENIRKKHSAMFCCAFSIVTGDLLFFWKQQPLFRKNPSMFGVFRVAKNLYTFNAVPSSGLRAVGGGLSPPALCLEGADFQQMDPVKWISLEHKNITA